MSSYEACPKIGSIKIFLLYCLSQQPCYSIAYMDDLFLLAPDTRTLESMVEQLQQRLAHAGLLINLSKCTVLANPYTDVIEPTISISHTQVPVHLPGTSTRILGCMLGWNCPYTRTPDAAMTKAASKYGALRGILRADLPWKTTCAQCPCRKCAPLGLPCMALFKALGSQTQRLSSCPQTWEACW